MRTYPFSLRRLLLAITALHSKTKYLPNTNRLASLDKTFRSREVKRINPRHLPLKAPVLTISPLRLQSKIKPISPLTSPFRNFPSLKIRRSNPVVGKEVKPAIFVQPSALDKKFHIKKVKALQMDNPAGKPRVGGRFSLSSPNFSSISKKEKDIFSAFLISLKRKMGV